MFNNHIWVGCPHVHIICSVCALSQCHINKALWDWIFVPYFHSSHVWWERIVHRVESKVPFHLFLAFDVVRVTIVCLKKKKIHFISRECLLAKKLDRTLFNYVNYWLHLDIKITRFVNYQKRKRKNRTTLSGFYLKALWGPLIRPWLDQTSVKKRFTVVFLYLIETTVQIPPTRRFYMKV